MECGVVGCNIGGDAHKYILSVLAEGGLAVLIDAPPVGTSPGCGFGKLLRPILSYGVSVEAAMLTARAECIGRLQIQHLRARLVEFRQRIIGQRIAYQHGLAGQNVVCPQRGIVLLVLADVGQRRALFVHRIPVHMVQRVRLTRRKMIDERGVAHILLLPVLLGYKRRVLYTECHGPIGIFSQFVRAHVGKSLDVACLQIDNGQRIHRHVVGLLFLDFRLSRLFEQRFHKAHGIQSLVRQLCLVSTCNGYRFLALIVADVQRPITLLRIDLIRQEGAVGRECRRSDALPAIIDIVVEWFFLGKQWI